MESHDQLIRYTQTDTPTKVLWNVHFNNHRCDSTEVWSWSGL